MNQGRLITNRNSEKRRIAVAIPFWNQARLINPWMIMDNTPCFSMYFQCIYMNCTWRSKGPIVQNYQLFQWTQWCAWVGSYDCVKTENVVLDSYSVRTNIVSENAHISVSEFLEYLAHRWKMKGSSVDGSQAFQGARLFMFPDVPAWYFSKRELCRTSAQGVSDNGLCDLDIQIFENVAMGANSNSIF